MAYVPLERGRLVNPADPEVLIQIMLTVVTNVNGIPLGVRCWKQHDYFSAFIGFATAAFSAMYHLADTLNARLLWMTPGNWHRLDNVFSILCFAGLALHLMDLHSRKALEILRWSAILITLWCQEKGPWEVAMTAFPTALWFVSLVLSYVIRWKRPRFNRNFVVALALLSVAVVFFARGLDEDNDYLRLNHGLWHLFASLAAYFFFASVPGSHANVYLKDKIY